jgi:hypothetical protein
MSKLDKEEKFSLGVFTGALAAFVGILLYFYILLVIQVGGLGALFTKTTSVVFGFLTTGIIMTILVLFIIGVFTYEVVNAFKRLQIGREHLYAFMQKTRRSEIKAFDIHEKDGVRAPIPRYLVMIDEGTPLLMNATGPNAVDRIVEKRYKFYDSGRYLLAVDKVYPSKVYLFA